MKKSLKLRVNSFFAGIGGFDLGFQRTGFEPVFHCESEPFCLSVLERHWPETTTVPDINDVDASELPFAEVWCGGFPCQDVSVARGNHGRDGLKGKQSSLFFVFHNLIKQSLPQVVLIENVTGLLNSHDGKDFQVIISSLTSLGYGVSWRVFNSRYFGAPQSRPRVFLCAWRGSVTMAVRALYEERPATKPTNERRAFLTARTCPYTQAIVPEISFCVAATSGRHTGNDWSRSYIAYKDSVRRPTPVESEGLQGFPRDWTMPCDDFPVPQRGLDSERYRSVGNAVSVPVVEWIAKRIRMLLVETVPSNSIEQQISPIDRSLKEAVIAVAPDFDSKTCVYINDGSGDWGSNNEAPRIRWASGGASIGSEVITCPVPSSPHKPITSYFVDILERSPVHPRYFISPNAAAGILRRVEKVGRVLFPPLQSALEKLCALEQEPLTRQDVIADEQISYC